MLNRKFENQRGFTLLELMIVVVIIAIISALAIPSYLKYVQRTRRSDGQSALLNTQQAEEKFFYRCSRYGSLDEIFAIGGPTCTQAMVAGAARNSPQNFYSISITNILTAPQVGYTLSATPQGVQANDPCGILSVDNNGTRGAAGDPAFGTDGDNLRCWH
jgi:type IV pilus assembly protein PilE